MRMKPTPAAATGLRVVLPEGWPRPSGYSQGVCVGAGRELVFVAGQVGWDARGRIVSPDFVAQFEQALRNCVAVVEASGGRAADIVRLTMFCADRREYLARLAEVGAAYRHVMGRHYPAMSLVQVAALLEEGALIEVEATAAVAAPAAELRP
jgi:enamine deaminase RidA (YjgF/YER057c/UK114 family)